MQLPILGETITAIDQIRDEEIIFHCKSGRSFKMYHEQDCCEYVSIEDITGDLQDLIGSPLLVAEEVGSEHQEKAEFVSETWTFYKFSTVKASVTIRWYGTSNGYYSESVSFEEVKSNTTRRY